MKIRPHTPPISVIFTMCILLIAAARLSGFEPTTRMAVKDGFWEINGKPTYEGTDTEGLLMGVRMVNCTFDDRNAKTSPKGFDADKNTEAFLKKLPRYASCGINTIILNLQGGDPGYAGSINSAFNPDGSLRAADLQRVSRVIEACDKIGAVVILGYFSPAQDQVLRDEAAVKAAVSNASSWLKKKAYTNVLVQVAEEHTSKKYKHAMIASPEGCASLIKAARATNPGMLVSASGAPNGRVANEIGDEANILLPRFNSTPLDRFNLMVVKLAKRSKAIVSVDDSKTGELAVAAMNLCVQSLCSWTYSNLKANQHYPFAYQGEEDDPGVYAELKKIVGN
ncbi:MAG: hypothetical protein VYB15_07140 [Planctomycetota bacterium]|nr:hypothetical protein [Planctomycetota bacterium]